MFETVPAWSWVNFSVAAVALVVATWLAYKKGKEDGAREAGQSRKRK